jgi:hypothetical protein
VHDAGLNDGFGKGGVDGFGKALQAVNDGNQDVGDTPALELVQPTHRHHARTRQPRKQKQAASLAGLAPIARQSGQWKGKSFIRGRRANVRQALYMPALVAARYNPDLKAKYQQLVAAGKPAKIAITAVMRKLVVTANALLKADRCWTQSMA